MNNIPESDQSLITDLKALIEQLDRMRRYLYTRRPGCDCNEERLCALHAEVWDDMYRASENLSRAMRQAQSEG